MALNKLCDCGCEWLIVAAILFFLFCCCDVDFTCDISLGELIIIGLVIWCCFCQ